MDHLGPDAGQPVDDAARPAAGVWGSYRALPRGWQTTIGVLVVLLLGAASGASSGVAEADKVLASTRSEKVQAADAQRAAQVRIDRLSREVSSLREQLASARIRSRAAARDAAAIAGLNERVAALTNRVATVRDRKAAAQHRASTAERRLAAEEALVEQLRAAAAVAEEPTSRDVVAPPPPPEDGECHPSYVGDCLPLSAVDVDCAGGSGDGPVYATRVEVVGTDVFGLDGDGDGWACE